MREETQEISEFVSESISYVPERCGQIPWSIGLWILFIPLVLAIGPLFLYIFIILMVPTIRKRRSSNREKEDDRLPNDTIDTMSKHREE